MRRTLALAALLALAACGSKHTTFTGELKIKPTAEANYQAGVEELGSRNFAEAVRFLELVRTKYPFSPYAPLAELRLADLKFEQDRYGEAGESYLQFVQLHPAHAEVDYARYRAGLSFFKDAPGDFALFPPAHEKDQRQAERAVQVLEEFVRTRRAGEGEVSKWVVEAEKVLAEARDRLAAREWYVGEFYFKRRHWAGAAGRYEGLVERYPGSRHEAEALWKLARARLALDEKFRARTALQQLLARHPEDPRRAEAERLLASLR